jgi:hypothetical protein
MLRRHPLVSSAALAEEGDQVQALLVQVSKVLDVHTCQHRAMGVVHWTAVVKASDLAEALAHEQLLSCRIAEGQEAAEERHGEIPMLQQALVQV